MHHHKDDAAPGGAKHGRLGRIHDRVLDTLAIVDGGQPADRALKATYRRARDLGRSERAEVSELVYAVARKRRRLEDTMRRALKTQRKVLSLFDVRLQHRWLVMTHLLEQGASVDDLEALDAYAYRRGKEALGLIARGRLKAPKRTDAGHLGVRHALPDWFAESLLEGYGETRAYEIGAALELRAPMTIRVNTEKVDRTELQSRLQSELGVQSTLTPFSPLGLIITERRALEGTDLYAEGLFDFQDEGSQLAALALGVEPGHNVVDACAGAGGKTLALASRMHGRGRIAAIEIDGDKVEILRARTRAAELTNVEPIKADLIDLPARLHGWADRVLVDAPCTGTGVYRRQPESRWRMTKKQAATFPERQAALLERAADAVKPGGLLAYVTCSLMHAENEAVVDRVIRSVPKLHPQSLASTWGPELANKLNADWSAKIGPGPSPEGPDAFFVALFRIEE